MRPMIVFLVAATACFGMSSAVRAADAPSFTKDIQPLLNRYCVQCHGQAKPKAGVRLDSYEGIMIGKRRAVVAGDPDQSRLILTMTGKGRLMPPKKTNRRPTAEEIDKIKAWIKEGAKKDDAKTEGASAAPWVGGWPIVVQLSAPHFGVGSSSRGNTESDSASTKVPQL
jgi:Planctomycete cytochrome C